MPTSLMRLMLVLAQVQTSLQISSQRPPCLKYSYLRAYLTAYILYLISLFITMNTVGYFRFLMQRSWAIKAILWISIVSFALSIVFTAADAVLSCEYSVLLKPCSYLTPDSPFQCSTEEQAFCCTDNTVDQCGTEELQCVLKPEKGIQVCSAMLITTWSLYLVFIGSFVLVIVLYRRVGPQMADDYVRMTQVTEISHSSSQASDHQNVQKVGIPNYML